MIKDINTKDKDSKDSKDMKDRKDTEGRKDTKDIYPRNIYTGKYMTWENEDTMDRNLKIMPSYAGVLRNPGKKDTSHTYDYVLKRGKSTYIGIRYSCSKDL